MNLGEYAGGFVAKTHLAKRAALPAQMVGGLGAEVSFGQFRKAYEQTVGTFGATSQLKSGSLAGSAKETLLKQRRAARREFSSQFRGSAAGTAFEEIHLAQRLGYSDVSVMNTPFLKLIHRDAGSSFTKGMIAHESGLHLPWEKLGPERLGLGTGKAPKGWKETLLKADPSYKRYETDPVLAKRSEDIFSQEYHAYAAQYRKAPETVTTEVKEFFKKEGLPQKPRRVSLEEINPGITQRKKTIQRRQRNLVGGEVGYRNNSAVVAEGMGLKKQWYG
jgi:hypothetical protein